MSETLKAWCHWKRKEKGVDEDTLEMVKDIEDVISQVGTYKAKSESLKAQLADETRACELLQMQMETLQQAHVQIRTMKAALEKCHEELQGHLMHESGDLEAALQRATTALSCYRIDAT